jgi:hypothetical protein
MFLKCIYCPVQNWRGNEKEKTNETNDQDSRWTAGGVFWQMKAPRERDAAPLLYLRVLGDEVRNAVFGGTESDKSAVASSTYISIVSAS